MTDISAMLSETHEHHSFWWEFADLSKSSYFSGEFDIIKFFLEAG